MIAKVRILSPGTAQVLVAEAQGWPFSRSVVWGTDAGDGDVISVEVAEDVALRINAFGAVPPNYQVVER